MKLTLKILLLLCFWYFDDEKINITGEGDFYKVKIPTSKIGEHIHSFYYNDEILSLYYDYEYEEYGILCFLK